jgi:FkbM family methyltransferase
MLIPFKEVITKYNLKPKGILHIGAWDGAEMLDYAAEGVTNVVFIEAQESIFPTLLGRIYRWPNAKAFLCCVSDKEEEVNFLVTSNGQSSSILELGEHAQIYPNIVVTESIKMFTTTVEKLFQKEGIDKTAYDFVNIDVQGAELKAIKGMGDMINHVKVFYLEVNKKKTYQDCALVEEIDEFLAGHNFKRVETSRWVDDCWGDAIYIRQ